MQATQRNEARRSEDTQTGDLERIEGAALLAAGGICARALAYPRECMVVSGEQGYAQSTLVYVPVLSRRMTFLRVGCTPGM